MGAPSWQEFLDRWAASRWQPVEAATVLQRLKGRDLPAGRVGTYVLAHRQWACGASDRVLWTLLDRAAAETCLPAGRIGARRGGERSGETDAGALSGGR
jgi:hypothetical protein